MSGYSSYPHNSYGPSNYSSYSNNYSRYNSGYNHNGYNNSVSPYSNTYSKPMPQNPENPQLPPPNFRQDVWGLLNGFQALLNVFYAGTGIVHFGKTFVKMSLKLIKAVCGKSASAIFKLMGLDFIKKIIFRSFAKDDWSKDFDKADQLLAAVWRSSEKSVKGPNQGLFGKILLVIRICSMLGTALALVLRNRSMHQNPPVSVQAIEPEGLSVSNVNTKEIEFQNMKNFYEDIRLIEEEQETAIKLGDNNDNMEAIKVDGEEVKEEPIVVITEEDGLNKEEIQFVSEEIGNNPLKVLEAQLVNSQNSLDEEKQSIKETQVALPQETLDTLMTSPILEQNQSVSQESVLQSNILPREIKRERIISEEFWKTTDMHKESESLNNKETQAEEKKERVYEAPSMLQALKEKSVSSNKPWLMKKKRDNV